MCPAAAASPDLERWLTRYSRPQQVSHLSGRHPKLAHQMQPAVCIASILWFNHVLIIDVTEDSGRGARS